MDANLRDSQHAVIDKDFFQIPAYSTYHHHLLEFFLNPRLEADLEVLFLWCNSFNKNLSNYSQAKLSLID